jgi:hypothetical protein
VLAGILTASKPLSALALAGLGLAILVGILTANAVSARVAPERQNAPSVVPFLLLCYALPMFVFNRLFALVGHSPYFLPDFLAVAAGGIGLFRARWRHLGLFAIVAGLIGVLMLHATYVGHHHGYPSATKGLVMVVYPVIAIPIAGWVAGRADIERLLAVLPRFVFPLVPIGMILAHHHHLVPSAYGLAYGCAGAFLIVPGIPNRKVLLVSYLIGAGLLISYSAERGVELTLLFSVATAWLATKRLRRLSMKTMMALAATGLVAIFAFSMFEGIIVIPSNVPFLSHIQERVSDKQRKASGDVTLRKLIWTYALATTWNEDPLLGVGAYHPISVSFGTADVTANDAVGTHNSFVGYTFYAGYPEGALVILVYAWGVLRLWRVRRRSIYAPAVLGSLVGVIVTAATNVAFELTYIGGPSWLILGLAFGLSAKLLDQPDPSPWSVSSSELDDGHRELVAHGQTTRDLPS